MPEVKVTVEYDGETEIVEKGLIFYTKNGQQKVIDIGMSYEDIKALLLGALNTLFIKGSPD